MNNVEGVSPEFKWKVEELIKKMSPDDYKSNSTFQFVKQLCEDGEFSEKWEQYLELRRKMDASTS